MEDMSDEEIEGLERAFDAVIAEERRMGRAKNYARKDLPEAMEEDAQFSIADPPDRDRATSQPAKAKDAAAAAAPVISAEVRRRLDKLLKKTKHRAG